MKIVETVKVRLKPDYVFDVDGQPFPWYIAEGGPTIVRYFGIYVVQVQIYCMDMKTKEVLQFSTRGYNGHTPVIGDAEFPWEITSDGYTFETSTKVLPSVTLSFFAKDVDVDNQVFIDDRRVFHNVDGEQVR